MATVAKLYPDNDTTEALATIEGEAELLGALLFDNELYSHASRLVGADDFHEPLHGRIFEAIGAKISDGQVASPVTLLAQFKADPDIARLGGTKYLAELYALENGVLISTDLAREIREMAIRRTLRDAMRKAADGCGDTAQNLAEIVSFASEVIAETPLSKSRRDSLGFSIVDWSANRFYGDAPKIKWLCENTIPQGVPALFAALGGIGKSFIALDLAFEIAATIASGKPRRILGGEVSARGRVVVLSAEDNRDSIHRRIERIDTGTRREAANGNVFVVPLPEVGGPMPLISGDRGEFRRTEKFQALLEQLRAIEDLKLIIIDPLQAFVTADITKDPAAGQFMWSSFAQICAETGATVIACHHMRKEGMSRIDSADSAREAIRGSTALIDGARATYALWSAGDDQARRVCSELNIDFQPKRVINGAVVKSNDEHDWDVHTYVRANTGLLEDRTEETRDLKQNFDRLTPSQQEEVLAEIDERWRQENPFSEAYNSPGRYLPNWIAMQFEVSKKVAKDHLQEWLIGGVIASEIYDSKSKKVGLRVKKWQ